jgi:putative Ca2+/H+ antiporter (TMEM165/GDT1 family)
MRFNKHVVIGMTMMAVASVVAVVAGFMLGGESVEIGKVTAMAGLVLVAVGFSIAFFGEDKE